jgi:hypothetical protein
MWSGFGGPADVRTWDSWLRGGAPAASGGSARGHFLPDYGVDPQSRMGTGIARCMVSR